MGVVGRYILTPSIFRHLRNIRSGAGGELQLTNGIAALQEQEAVLSYEFEGTRYDCGSKQGYLQATVRLALRRVEVKEEFRAFLNSIPHEMSTKLWLEPSDTPHIVSNGLRAQSARF